MQTVAATSQDSEQAPLKAPGTSAAPDLEREKTAWSTQPEVEFPEGGLQAWLTIFGSFLVQYTTFGYINSFGVYQDYYVRVYLTNYTPSQIGWIGGTQIFLLFITGLFSGAAVERGYLRHIMFSATGLQALALFTLSASHPNKYYQVFLSQSVCLGLACGLGFIPSLSIVSHYFHKKRPQALGIVAAGSGLGAVLHPIMLNKLFSGSVGFNNGVRASGALNTSLLLIASLIMRTRLPPKQAEPLPIKAFFSDIEYVTFVIGCVLSFFGIFYPIFYIQLNGIIHGINPNFAFHSLSIMNAASIVGRVVPPMLAPKLGVLNVQIFVTLTNSVICCTMSVVHDVAGTTVFSIFSGLFSGATISMAPIVLSSLSKDVKEVGARLAIMYALGGVVSLVALPILGALLTSSFHWLRASLFAGLTLLGAVPFMVIARLLVVRRKGSQFV